MSEALDTRAKEAHVWRRDDLDWYVEEKRCTSQLLSVERFHGPVLDPCCGQGNIVETCQLHGLEAVGSDIRRRTDAAWFLGEADFLSTDRVEQRDLILNPPFFRGKGTEAFIRHALKLATGKVAVFADLKFLAGAGRANGLWADLPPSRIWIITPRPSCPPGEWLAAGNKAGGGTADWVWIVWDLTAPATAMPPFGWLRGRK